MSELLEGNTFPEEPSDKQIADACMWYRHDFGLLHDDAKRVEMNVMRSRWRAIWKACNTPGVAVTICLLTPDSTTAFVYFGVHMNPIELAAANNRQGWKDDAAAALIKSARKVGSGTIEEFHRGVDIDPPRDERAWGAVVQLLEREGWIRKTARFRPARSSHHSPKRVWTFCG